MNFSLIAVLICQGLLILIAVYLIWSWISQTPFYPSSSKDLDRLINNSILKIPEQIKFVDIGSGDGRFVTWAARKGFQAHGIEFNPFLTLWSKTKLFVRGLRKNSKIFNKNFIKHDFSQYNFAYMYIFPEHMDAIKEKLYSEMKPGSIIVSKVFKFSNMEPDIVIDKFNIYYVK